MAVAALVDRLVHHAEVLVLRGDSYRLKGKGKEVLSDGDDALRVFSFGPAITVQFWTGVDSALVILAASGLVSTSPTGSRWIEAGERRTRPRVHQGIMAPGCRETGSSAKERDRLGRGTSVFRKVTPGTTSRLTSVDHAETYGRHILNAACKEMSVAVCADLGCGSGDDLMIVKKRHPQARCIGVDFGDWNRERLSRRGIESVSLDIESEALPFEDETVDLIIANQVLEHTKQLFFINHEVFRTLRVGGHLYLGVPNVLSLHNRVLGLVGTHPTCAKLISGHVRVFSKRDTIFFYEHDRRAVHGAGGVLRVPVLPVPTVGRASARVGAAVPCRVHLLLVQEDGDLRGRVPRMVVERAAGDELLRRRERD